MSYKYDKSKKSYTDLKGIEVGDIIFEDCESGPCSGGARYGIGEKVLEVNSKMIKTTGGKYDRKEGYNLKLPVYVIQYYQKS
jgi:hypothetical protein